MRAPSHRPASAHFRVCVHERVRMCVGACVGALAGARMCVYAGADAGAVCA